MSALLARLRAWLTPISPHPAKALADRKRRLETLLQREGMSRMAARRIAVEFFADSH